MVDIVVVVDQVAEFEVAVIGIEEGEEFLGGIIPKLVVGEVEGMEIMVSKDLDDEVHAGLSQLVGGEVEIEEGCVDLQPLVEVGEGEESYLSVG